MVITKIGYTFGIDLQKKLMVHVYQRSVSSIIYYQLDTALMQTFRKPFFKLDLMERTEMLKNWFGITTLKKEDCGIMLHKSDIWSRSKSLQPWLNIRDAFRSI